MKSRTRLAWPRIASMVGGLLVFLCAPPLAAAAEPGAFFVTSVAEKKLTALPSGILYWRVETFPEPEQARAAAAVSATSLTATVDGKAWLFTLGPMGGATQGGTKVAEIGPVPRITAPEYLLRINHAGGPPGAKTPVHSHPGSETFYVLGGQVTQRTPDGASHAEAGQSAVGHGADMPMEVSSSGGADLNLLVMFVLDATKPFSTPAKIE
ncbi:MAG TPA: cupin domain-containing protein [Aliidongia sp.]|uniref:cupin domain-containing protein n=1 Tax=Aliidongia sp. TaxID=1914230 RepID=UPI002DDD102C|nr:cupin domain-containing protein [Aliidongia sp.]HEV2678566.1 cupin domain-containing protein [Aliidongia sp.]